MNIEPWMVRAMFVMAFLFIAVALLGWAARHPN